MNTVCSIWWEIRNTYRILDRQHEWKSPYERSGGSCQSTWHHIPENSNLHPHYMVSHHKTVLFAVMAVRTWDSPFYSSEDYKHSVLLNHSWFSNLMTTIGDEEYRVWNSLFCNIPHSSFCSSRLVTNILIHILFSILIGFIIKYPFNKNVLELD